MMTELENTLLESTGVIGISDMHRTDKTGCWNVLVKGQAFKTVRKQFTSNIQDWIHGLSTTTLETIPPGFTPPQV
jgi:hypothetical protein